MPQLETDNKTIAERYGEAWNGADLEAIMAMQGEDMVFQLHTDGFVAASGADEVRAQFELFFDAWQEMRFETTQLRVDGELVTNEYRFSGRLAKPFPLLGEVISPPYDGRRIEIDGMDVITIRDGLVRSKDTYMDTLALRRQLEQAIVDGFTDAWQKCDPDAFTPLLHPEVELIHPMERNTRGIEEARAFLARTMDLIPGLRFEVGGWAGGSGHVLIWGRLHGTVTGKPVEWPLVDKIRLEDGLIRERVAFFDPMVIGAQLMRNPRAWPSYLRAQLKRFRAR